MSHLSKNLINLGPSTNKTYTLNGTIGDSNAGTGNSITSMKGRPKKVKQAMKIKVAKLDAISQDGIIDDNIDKTHSPSHDATPAPVDNPHP